MATRPTDFNSDAARLAWVRANPDAPIVCACNGKGCSTCDNSGEVPAWVVDPEITGYPHKRKGR